MLLVCNDLIQKEKVKKIMKKIICMLLAAMMILSLAACGGSSAPAATQAPAAEAPAADAPAAAPAPVDEEVTLRLALWDYEVDGPTTYEPIIKAFEADYPNIHIEVVSSPNADYETKLTTMLSGGDDIDLFFAKSNTALPGLQAKEFCMDLSPMIASHSYDMAPYGTVVDQQMTFDGDVYALPFRTNDWVLFYNKDLFDAAGVAYPSNDMTWQKVGEVAKEIVANSDDGIYGYCFNPKLGFIFPALAGTVDGFDITTSDLAPMTTALDWVMDMMESGAMEEYSESVSMSKDQNYFLKGEWAMMWDGSWFVQNLKNGNVDFNWGIAKAPYWEGTTKNGFVTSTPLCISAETKNAEAAFTFLTYICGEKGASILATTTLVPGYMNDAVMDSYKANAGVDADSLAALVDNVTYSFGSPNTIFSQIISAGQKEMDLVLTHNETPAEFVENFTATRAELIENAD